MQTITETTENTIEARRDDELQEALGTSQAWTPGNGPHTFERQMWLALFDSLGEGILIVSPDRAILGANQAMCKILDTDLAGLLVSSCHKAIRGRARPCAGCTPTYMPCLLDPPGARRRFDANDYSMSVAPILDECESVQAHLFRFRNMTEERRAQQYLSTASRLVALEGLAAGVAHNFGNVLMSISATLELLQMRAVAEPAVSDLEGMISGALDQVEKGAEIIQRLMALAKGAPSVIVATDVKKAVQNAISLCVTHSQAKRVELVNEVPNDAAPVRADAGQFEEVLVNLMLNALQWSEHGRIRVGARMSQSPECLEVYVADEGAGIAPEDMNRIFDPFFSRRKDGASGRGLGLSCSIAQVSRMGGNLTAESKLGVGSTFTITLPKWVDEWDAVQSA